MGIISSIKSRLSGATKSASPKADKRDLTGKKIRTKEYQDYAKGVDTDIRSGKYGTPKISSTVATRTPQQIEIDAESQRLYNEGKISLTEAAERHNQALNLENTSIPPSSPAGSTSAAAGQKKGFLLDQLSTATSIAGGVVGSLGGPLGTIAGAGLGGALGESVENLATGQPLGKGVLKTGAIDAALGGAGLGVAKIISKLAGRGVQLAATEGLSVRAVAKAASGIRVSKAVEASLNALKQSNVNTWSAKKVISHVAKITANKKYSLIVQGVVANTVLNGFLDEETIQTLDFEITKQIDEGYTEQALELIEMKEEIEDLDLWQALGWLIPGSGAVKYLTASAKKTAAQKKRIEKGLEETQTQKEQVSQFQETGELSPELEPKWRDNPEKPGKVLPNEDNPDWVKKDGKLIWTGE